MKIIVTWFSLSLLSACAHTPGPAKEVGFSGVWYSAQIWNATDRRLDDCHYKSDGTYECSVLDRGCTGKFCEAQTFTIAGTWALQGDRLVRTCDTEMCQNDSEEWTVVGQDEETLSLSTGERWFRTKAGRARGRKRTL